jgi:N-methylhydantoinase B/oxoprolinase/acetone carboxylase alpha subunit
VKIDKARGRALIDFNGSSGQLKNNFNAPLAVVKSAVLYVFRTLVEDDIPLNSGCMNPLALAVPEGSFLNPHFPAAVVAGNVETSQYIVDALYGALKIMAASQGTMNNFTFGNDKYQYYETVCGGAGASVDFDGADAVHTHMTNSRITDPEILELRFPVILESFEIRRGSGGCGKHKGGDGVIRKIKFFENMHASILSSHRKFPPLGIDGGKPGKLGCNYVIRSSGERLNMPGCAFIEMYPGDTFVIETPGGAGQGQGDSLGTK